MAEGPPEQPPEELPEEPEEPEEQPAEQPFVSYEQYLEAQVTPRDLYYLESEEVARQLARLGFIGSKDVLQREEFEAQQAAAAALMASASQKLLASTGKELKDNFLQALAEREEANRDGKLSSIIYIRDYNSRHQEVSAYIDYAYRLTTDDFEAYFSGKKRLLPRKTDLSFYNWNKNVVSSNPSPNYEVIAENSCGLLFKNKMDGKIINVNPKVYPGDNTTRTPVKTNLYLHMVIYDHIVGREP
ncbi:cilia- and flagella-associated protein 299 isoform X3 [Anas acuta]|uniref:cilia- and flagella-associated protein 299 isoform X3 n=1 Tax=Anas acuta TaxID=28680 RepID=UPI0035C8CAFA